VIDRIRRTCRFIGHVEECRDHRHCRRQQSVWWSADDKFSITPRDKIGVAVPKTVLLTFTSLATDTNETRSQPELPTRLGGHIQLRRLARFLQAVRGGGWKM